MKRSILLSASLLAGAAALGVVAVFAATTDTLLRGGDTTTVRCDGKSLSSTRVDTKTVRLNCVASVTPPPTVPPPPPPTATPPAGGSATVLGGCNVYPANNAWNQDISAAPLDPNSTNYINAIQTRNAANPSRQKLHADFGSDPTYGIPFDIVPSTQALVPITFNAYGNESDPGPYPIPPAAKVEAGSDHHVLVLQQGTCKLYEMFNAFKNANGGWTANSGAVFDLNSNALRPDGWTSADAAGLPILPGLVRKAEIQSGKITHALRFTVSQTQKGYIHPATHYASSSLDTSLLPMGARLRLKASFDTSAFTGDTKVILEALKTYGMFVADNGSDWFISGEQGAAWNDTDLNQLKTISGSNFEVVQSGPILR